MRQNRKPITKRAIDALKPGRSIADDRVRGFIARRLRTGTVTFGFRYTSQVTGKRRWLPLGLFGGLAPEEARKLAQKAAGEVAAGKDPLEHQQASRADAKRKADANTINDLLDRFLDEYVDEKKLRTADEIRSAIHHWVRPSIGEKLTSDVRRADIVAMCDEIADATSPRRADTILAYVRKAFNWYAEKADDTFTSPIKQGMARVKPSENMRQRALSDDEIREVWSALNHVHPAYADVLRILLYTGSRLNEIGCLAYGEINDDAIIVPAERTKSNKAHAIPLTPRLRQIIESRQAVKKSAKRAKYVFWGRKGGTVPFQGWSAQKKQLDAIIALSRKERGADPMPQWRHHDLRRTARSLMGRAGVNADIAERIIGHEISGVRKVYDVYAYFNEKQDGLLKYEALLQKILSSCSNRNNTSPQSEGLIN